MVDQPPTLLGGASIETLVRLARSAPEGDFAEVGVYKGGAAWYLYQIAEARGSALLLFDTFTGIPEAGPEDIEHKVGEFNAGGDQAISAIRAAMPKAVLYIGVFPGTLPHPREFSPRLAFVHVDCDQYASVSACIHNFVPLLVPRGIMLFDDYNATSGCTKAVDEAFGGKHRLTPEGKAYFTKGDA